MPTLGKIIKPKFYATWGGKRKPKFQPDGAGILRELSIFTRPSSSSALKNMWEVPGGFSAEQARVGIKMGDPRVKMRVKNGRRVFE